MHLFGPLFNLVASSLVCIGQSAYRESANCSPMDRVMQHYILLDGYTNASAPLLCRMHKVTALQAVKHRPASVGQQNGMIPVHVLHGL